MCYSILIVDDHPIMRTGVLATIQNLTIQSYQAENGKEALSVLANHPIQLVILDIKMPVMDGIDAAYIIRKRYPKIKIVINSRCENFHLINKLIQIGVKGFHSKNDKELIPAIKSAMNGRFFFSTKLVPFVNDLEQKTIKPIQLSSKATRILHLCAAGHSSAEIAAILGLQPGSIETYRKRLLKRYGVSNITEMVDFAHRIGKL